MDTRWRKFSRSIITKAVLFLITILCFSSLLTMGIDIAKVIDGDLRSAFEESYYQGNDFIADSNNIASNLRELILEYKNEEHILSGAALTKDELENAARRLFYEFRENSRSYNPNLRETENYEIFKKEYAQEIAELRSELIQEDLDRYHNILRRLGQYRGVWYYAGDGKIEITNSPDITPEFFQSSPAYLIMTSTGLQAHPAEIEKNPRYSWLLSNQRELFQQEVIYIAFSEEFIAPRLEKWEQNQRLVNGNINQIGAYLAGFAAAFICLVFIIGRKPEDDRVHLNSLDRIYNDLNLGLCLSLIIVWIAMMVEMSHIQSNPLFFPVTFFIAALGLLLVLSLIKHIKNGTFIRHSLIYTIFARFFGFLRDIYDSGSIGVKVIIIVVGYPLLAAATFFMFPITIGAAAWLALKKVKEFKAIQEGVQKVKDGDLSHTIDITGNGEFARLAAHINGITDGLNKAVVNELKSERLKAELISNVSHDIRTPLTSIITYVDLLKKEEDATRIKEYIEVLEQKSQRLKVLTDDLFEAAKVSSGNIPVNWEVIDLAALITQGLGEMDHKIQERQLEFRLNTSKDRVLVNADGKLLWRAIENLLGNVLKYALAGSRVYIDIEETGTEVILTIKNISAYELNISPDELIERFKRGDESRSSQGSGLGLSIAKSLVEIQKGSFRIEIDGDLFKAVIQLKKAD